MKKSKRSSPSAAFPVFWVILIGVTIFGVAQLVKAATGGIQGSPGTKYDAVQLSDSISSTNENYENMPGMTVSFMTSGQGPGIVTVAASPPSTSTSFGGCGYFMRLVVDGNAQPEEVPVFFPTWDSRSFTFVTPSLATGSHTVNVQWKQTFFLGSPCAVVRSMTVFHQ